MTVQRGPRLWLALLGVAVLTAAAGLVGRELYRPRVEEVTVSQPPAGATSGSKTPSSSVEPPGPPGVVATQDVVQHPQYNDVKQMVQDYFDAINEKSYDKFRTTITAARAREMDRNTFDKDYATTTDGTILIYRMEAAPENKLRVLLSFTSKQAVEAAPPELQKECIQWRVVWPLTKEGNRWRLDIGPEAKAPRHEECGAEPS
jgi:hypothetical protein